MVAREQLHADVQAGIDQLDRGEGFEAEEVYPEARHRIKAIEIEQT